MSNYYKSAAVVTVILSVAMAVLGCSSESSTTPAVAPAPAGLSRSQPTRIVIPSLDVESAIIDLGLQQNGEMQVPPDAKDTGWFKASPTPGEIGPSVLAAHVNWKGENGPFFEVHKMKPGDAVNVQREDGTTAEFKVTKVERYDKSAFPTDAVYGDVETAQLRMITCGGAFDAGAQSYRDNIVVYAEMV